MHWRILFRLETKIKFHPWWLNFVFIRGSTSHCIWLQAIKLLLSGVSLNEKLENTPFHFERYRLFVQRKTTRTIWPSCYAGRLSHVRFEIYWRFEKFFASIYLVQNRIRLLKSPLSSMSKQCQTGFKSGSMWTVERIFFVINIEVMWELSSALIGRNKWMMLKELLEKRELILSYRMRASFTSSLSFNYIGLYFDLSSTLL